MRLKKQKTKQNKKTGLVQSPGWNPKSGSPHSNMDTSPINIYVAPGSILFVTFRHLDLRCDDIALRVNHLLQEFCGAFLPPLMAVVNFLPLPLKIMAVYKKGLGSSTQNRTATGFRLVFSFVKV